MLRFFLKEAKKTRSWAKTHQYCMDGHFQFVSCTYSTCSSIYDIDFDLLIYANCSVSVINGLPIYKIDDLMIYPRTVSYTTIDGDTTTNIKNNDFSNDDKQRNDCGDKNRHIMFLLLPLIKLLYTHNPLYHTYFVITIIIINIIITMTMNSNNSNNNTDNGNHNSFDNDIDNYENYNSNGNNNHNHDTKN